MKIKPNASPDEILSPFFKKNEEFCDEFESFIAKNGGKVKGKYNASSYLIFGKISSPKKWNLAYKKSTFTSSGNLFLSSKRQSLFVMAEWETDRVLEHNTEFSIRRKVLVDYINLIVSNSLSKLEGINNYVVKVKNEKPMFISKLIQILKPLFESKEVYKIENKNGKLKIELRTEKHHFDIFNKLIESL